MDCDIVLGLTFEEEGVASLAGADQWLRRMDNGMRDIWSFVF